MSTANSSDISIAEPWSGTAKSELSELEYVPHLTKPAGYASKAKLANAWNYPPKSKTNEDPLFDCNVNFINPCIETIRFKFKREKNLPSLTVNSGIVWTEKNYHRILVPRRDDGKRKQGPYKHVFSADVLARHQTLNDEIYEQNRLPVVLRLRLDDSESFIKRFRSHPLMDFHRFRDEPLPLSEAAYHLAVEFHDSKNVKQREDRTIKRIIIR